MLSPLTLRRGEELVQELEGCTGLRIYLPGREQPTPKELDWESTLAGTIVDRDIMDSVGV